MGQPGCSSFFPRWPPFGNFGEKWRTDFWDAQNGSRKATIPAHEDRVNTLAIAPGSQLAVSGSWDGTAKIWDVPSRRNFTTLKGIPRLLIRWPSPTVGTMY
ncbi:MAG: hypothetical protein H6555_00890 [Lewinellaceae bacterium]|nr:hypothetical protein [Lewinellaceae bacterium]